MFSKCNGKLVAMCVCEYVCYQLVMISCTSKTAWLPETKVIFKNFPIAIYILYSHLISQACIFPALYTALPMACPWTIYPRLLELSVQPYKIKASANYINQ